MALTHKLFVKPGVDLNGLAPAGGRILGVLALAPLILDHDVTITCGKEGHPPTDHHTTGEAIDVRVIDLTPDQILAFRAYLHAHLGPRFTVLYEVPLDQRALLPAELAAIVYGPSNPDAPHLHAQLSLGQIWPNAQGLVPADLP